MCNQLITSAKKKQQQQEHQQEMLSAHINNTVILPFGGKMERCQLEMESDAILITKKDE